MGGGAILGVGRGYFLNLGDTMDTLLQAATLERIESEQVKKMIEEARRNRERLNLAKASRAARRVWYVCLLDGSD